MSLEPLRVLVLAHGAHRVEPSAFRWRTVASPIPVEAPVTSTVPDGMAAEPIR